jgi:hypothetical protein
MPIATVTTADVASLASGHLLSLRVRMPDGGVLTPSARTGERVIDALAAFGVPVRRDVGADTCCLYDRLVTPDLDGIELTVPWDALVPQTSWVAG